MEEWIPVAIALITVIGPLLIADWIANRKAAKQQAALAIEEAKKAGKEEARAEAYRDQAVATISDLEQEITELSAKLAESSTIIDRLANREIPRYQRIIDGKEAVIKSFADSFEKISRHLEAQ